MKRTNNYLLALMGAIMLSANALSQVQLKLTVSDSPELVDYDVNGDGKTDEGEKAYKIESANDLYWFAGLVNGTIEGVEKNDTANAYLAENIVVNENLLSSLKYDVDGNVTNASDLNIIEWSPIGYVFNYAYFKGTFDGNGRTISGLYFNNSNQNSVGFIGGTDSETIIKNLGIVDSYFKAGGDVAAVCGNSYGTITNCYNTSIIIGNNSVGGVCGYCGNTITNCYNAGVINGNEAVGGVCGFFQGTIEKCYNAGSVSGNQYVGGVCGQGLCTVKSCYNTGRISGKRNIGGVFGYNMFGSIINCYNTGSVSGDENVGGVTGLGSATITNCYYLKTSDEQGIGYGEGDATSATAEEFANGDVAHALHDYDDNAEEKIGSDIWGQYVGIDEIPTFRGKFNPTQITEENRAEYNLSTDYIGYYAIGDADDLYWFANYVNKGADNAKANGVLVNNIVVNENVLVNGSLNTNAETVANFREWFPIGYYYIGGYDYVYYQGTFDGNGKTVSGLYFNDPNTDLGGVGLFGNIESLAVIKNVGVIDSYFNGGNNIASVCGYNNEGTIENCYNTSVVSGDNGVGGVCGYNEGAITNCYNTSSINGGEYVGGVCGNSFEGTIKNCYSTGSVSGNDDIKSVGGVVGKNDDSSISNSYFNTDFYRGNAVGEGTVGENVEGKSTIELATIFNENDSWMPGSAIAIKAAESDENYTVVVKFPKLKSFDYQPTFNGSFAIEIVNKIYDEPELLQNDIKSISLTFGGQTYSEINEHLVLYKNDDESNYTTARGSYYGVEFAVEVPAFLPVEGVYHIKNTEYLLRFSKIVAKNPSANAVLDADITFNDGTVFGTNGKLKESLESWVPIGTTEMPYVGRFNATSDGGAVHTISGLYIDEGTNEFVGLFSKIGEGAQIANIAVVNSYIKGGYCVGAIAGCNGNGTIENCYNTSDVNGIHRVSGVCGLNSGTIKNCYNTGVIKGSLDSEYVGGVCKANSGYVTNCYDFKLNGGTMDAYNIVVNDYYITLPTKISREGYTFDGWFSDEDLNAKTIELEFNGEHILYAKWQTPTAIKAVEAENNKTIKTIKDGQIVIIRDGVMYDMQGRKL